MSDARGALLVCATPIGNLADMTLRAIEELGRVDVIACEDTRHSQVLLRHHGIDARELVSYHEHNEHRRAGELVERMLAGANVALLSDAGMPLVSDPGFELVRAAIDADVPVRVLPGASSVLSAAALSGLPVATFCFCGFLPRRGGELRRLLAANERTLIAFESPRRLAASLTLLAEQDPDRPVVVCRELTKLHEEVRRASAAELAVYYREHPPRGEIVVVIGAAPEGQAQLTEALHALRSIVAAGARPRPAAAAIAKLTGLRANELYRSLR